MDRLPFAFPRGFRLLLALDAGLLVMLTLPDFLENATAGTLPLKPFERTFQGLIFTDTNLRHFYPSSRSKKRLSPASQTDRSAKPWCYYSRKGDVRQSFFQKNCRFYYPKVILSHRSKSDFVSNRLDLVNYQTSEGRADHHQKGGLNIGTGSEVSGCKKLRRSSGQEQTANSR